MAIRYTSLGHIGLRVREMARKGIPCRHNADDSVAWDGCWCSFITDPEGHQLEFMQFLSQSLPLQW